ncbi:enoyl-CoA hydratase [Strigomonas culicis]|uniref:3-hydroxyisobutyryl-CoA hydrolase n=1 Tax=Strigomonas culicis TaxID=28005 RepID=S9W6B3_9TRYP|nr:enoyl-CoA hydratase [Strigomonas culicis]|eukprot:EPY34781.1 enoyl-CoA hydratase [Strigomonas culicis]
MRASCLRYSAAAAEALVLHKDYPKARVITLNRPKGLNALNTVMIHALRDLVVDHPHPDAKAVVVIKSAVPKSFSTGGDIIEQSGKDSREVMGRWSCVQGQVDYHILIATNPFVSLLNGYVMGGAAGLALNGRYRVATETTQFAMPECSIGFFPNGGATWFLPRVPIAGLGLYLGLTGSRLKAGDLVHAGLATHYIPSTEFGALEQALATIEDPFYVSSCVGSFQKAELPPLSFEQDLPVLERVFSLRPDTTVEGIIEALKGERSPMAAKALETMQRCSPLSLKLTLEQQKRSLRLPDYLEALKNEVFASQRLVEEPDFKEGVRALKTGDPSWKPPTLADVSDALVGEMFGTKKKGYYYFEPTGGPFIY